MKLFKMPRLTPKITWTQLTGFKKSDFGMNFKPKKRRRQTIKKILKNV